jgi:hypothetical protein
VKVLNYNVAGFLAHRIVFNLNRFMQLGDFYIKCRVKPFCSLGVWERQAQPPKQIILDSYASL